MPAESSGDGRFLASVEGGGEEGAKGTRANQLRLNPGEVSEAMSAWKRRRSVITRGS